MSALGYRWTSKECIFDSQGDAVEGQVSNRFLEEPILNLAKNEFGNFEATIPYQLNSAIGQYTNPIYKTLKFQKTWMEVLEDDVPIWLGYVTETEKQFDLSYRVYVTGVLGQLQNYTPKIDGGTYFLTAKSDGTVPTDSLFYKSVAALKDYYQGPYGTFGIGKVTIQLGNTIDTTNQGTLFLSQWNLLQTYLLDEYDGYLRTRIVQADNGSDVWRIYVDYLLDTDEKTTQAIEFGVNLLDFSYLEQMASDIVTRVTAYGTQTTTSGWWIFKTTTVSAISKKAQEELDNYRQSVEPVMTLTAYDRRDGGEDVQRLGFLKKTRIISSPHELDQWLVCVKLTLPLDSLDNKVFSFGLTPEKLTKQQQVEAVKEKIQSVMDAIISFLNQWLGLNQS